MFEKKSYNVYTDIEKEIMELDLSKISRDDLIKLFQHVIEPRLKVNQKHILSNLQHPSEGRYALKEFTKNIEDFNQNILITSLFISKILSMKPSIKQGLFK